jgi:hypothetical protein
MNSKVARLIYFVSAMAFLVGIVQAVRFGIGHTGAPGVDELFAGLNATFGAPHPDEAIGPAQGMVAFAAWVQKCFHILAGVLLWLFLGDVARGAAWTLGRIVEVGFTQYREDVKQAMREAAIERDRDQRREAQREARRREEDANRPKSGFSMTTLVIGIFIGTMF